MPAELEIKVLRTPAELVEERRCRLAQEPMRETQRMPVRCTSE